MNDRYWTYVVLLIALAIGGGLCPRARAQSGRPLEIVGDELALPASIDPFAPTQHLWHVQRDYDPLPQITTRQLAPGSVTYRYGGLQSFAVRKLQGRFRSLWEDQLDTWIAHTNVSELELQRWHQAMSDSVYDHFFNGRWWDRNWTLSLPEAQGGAPTELHVEQIGERIELFRVGPARFYNTLSAKARGLSMLFDERPGRVYRSAEEGRQGYARHDARLDRSLGEPPTSTDAARERPPGSPPRFGTMGYVALELDPVGAAFPDSVAWEFKLRPAVRGGIPSGGDLSGFVRRVYVRGRVDFLLGAQRQRVVRLEGEVSYRPGEDELSLGFELALLSW